MTTEKEPFVIRMEVDRMRETVRQAIMLRQEAMNDELQRVVDAVVTEENVMTIIELNLRKEIEQSIRDELHAFFQYGAGKKAVRDTAMLALREVFFPEGENSGS